MLTTEYHFGAISNYDKNWFKQEPFKLLKLNMKALWQYLFGDIIYFKYVTSATMCWYRFNTVFGWVVISSVFSTASINWRFLDYKVFKTLIYHFCSQRTCTLIMQSLKGRDPFISEESRPYIFCSL